MSAVARRPWAGTTFILLTRTMPWKWVCWTSTRFMKILPSTSKLHTSIWWWTVRTASGALRKQAADAACGTPGISADSLFTLSSGLPPVCGREPAAPPFMDADIEMFTFQCRRSPAKKRGFWPACAVARRKILTDFV